MYQSAVAIITAHNEARNYYPDLYRGDRLDRVVDALVKSKNRGYIQSVIAVNDGSTDFTGVRLGMHKPEIVVLHHKNYSGEPENRGKLAAVLTGLKYVRQFGNEINKEGIDSVVLVDADFDNLDPDSIKRLLMPLQNIGIDATVEDYVQGEDKCGYDTSGLRAVKLSVFEPWLNPTHPDYKIWSHILKPKRINASELPNMDMGKREVITTGYSLETLLLLMKERYNLNVKELPYSGLTSRERGCGACTLDEINAGIKWAESLWEGMFPERMQVRQ